MGKDYMDGDIFRGQLVRLTAEDPQEMAEAFARWRMDTEYMRLLDNDVPVLFSVKKMKEWFEKGLEDEDEFFFGIRNLEEDRLIGFIGLFGFNRANGEAWVGIGLGEREFWGKGFGTDAMKIILRYAFTELNLYRVSLGAFEYNPRALRSYEKAGFSVEGRKRGALHREGARYDAVQMGILKNEWFGRQDPG